MNLIYKSAAMVEDLALNECVMRACTTADGSARFWHLWFRVARETDGVPEVFVVPMNPNGSYVEQGPGGKTWGLARSGPNTWQVDPSINVLNTYDLHPGEHPTLPSLWHQTPAILGVPDDERWTTHPA